MKLFKLDDMVKGWFVGNFVPTLYKTEDVEIAVKRYKKGELEDEHYHQIATEITVIVFGRVRMNKKEYQEGDVLIIEPEEITDFEALTDVITTVVKLPSVCDDKYLNRSGNNA